MCMISDLKDLIELAYQKDKLLAERLCINLQKDLKIEAEFINSTLDKVLSVRYGPLCSIEDCPGRYGPLCSIEDCPGVHFIDTEKITEYLRNQAKIIIDKCNAIDSILTSCRVKYS